MIPKGFRRLMKVSCHVFRGGAVGREGGTTRSQGPFREIQRLKGRFRGFQWHYSGFHTFLNHALQAYDINKGSSVQTRCFSTQIFTIVQKSYSFHF